MSGRLILGVSCLCGGELEDVNQSHSAPYRTVMVLQCVTCRRELALEVVLSVLSKAAPKDWGEFGVPQPGLRCGTESGFQAHKRDGETPCDRCREARRVAERARKKNAKAREVAA